MKFNKMNRRSTALLVISMMLLSSAIQVNAQSDFKMLFDGKSTDGWRGYQKRTM